LNFIKIKNICIPKVTINKLKILYTPWEKIFENPISDMEIVSRIHKELLEVQNNKINNPIGK
jgi:hypothetical protein